MRILVAEDEKDLNRLISDKLKKDGYAVDSCFDGRDALDYMKSADYDRVIMDVMMPVMDGFETVKRYRAGGGKAPVLFLTARDSIEDRVRGLDIGANDYLVKPFSFRELGARIRVMTRTAAASSADVYTVADLVLDSRSKTARRAGKKLSLSAKEFALLEYMMRNRGRVLSRRQIENNLYNYDYEGGTNVVDVYIRYLRKKVDEGFDKKLIHTVRGAGYVIREDDKN